MFNSLSGLVTHKGAEDVCLLNSSGIEWDIAVSAKTLAMMPEEGTECRLFIYFLHREDSMKLYGFFTEDERSCFLELLKVNGIGTKQAMKMLSSVTVEQLVKALDKEDLAVLSGIPGIGKKTAQKILLSLRGRLVSPAEEPETKSKYSDIVNGLADMGFDYKQTVKVVEQIMRDPEMQNLDAGELEKAVFKQAIVLLSSQNGY